MSHVFQVQVGKGNEKYRTKYSFTVDSIHCSRAWLWYSSINTGPGYKKRLLRDGKVIARCFG